MTLKVYDGGKIKFTFKIKPFIYNGFEYHFVSENNVIKVLLETDKFMWISNNYKFIVTED